MQELLESIKACTACNDRLQLGSRPIVTADSKSKIIIVGQAPGLAVHESGIPWDDKSGDKLRNWLGVEKQEFYNTENFAIVPMGFCYPGRGKTGDLPPMKICAPLWHEELLLRFENLQLLLLIGKYAQDYYLPKSKKLSLTERVRNFQDYLPRHFVLPHPSPRNNIWQAKNPWFTSLVLPRLRENIGAILRD